MRARARDSNSGRAAKGRTILRLSTRRMRSEPGYLGRPVANVGENSQKNPQITPSVNQLPTHPHLICISDSGRSSDVNRSLCMLRIQDPLKTPLQTKHSAISSYTRFSMVWRVKFYRVLWTDRSRSQGRSLLAFFETHAKKFPSQSRDVGVFKHRSKHPRKWGGTVAARVPFGMCRVVALYIGRKYYCHYTLGELAAFKAVDLGHIRSS
jgi:hypothetical protein